MKIRQAVFSVALLGLLFIVAGCDNRNSAGNNPPAAKVNNLESGATHHFAGVGVAVADMDGDGDLDIIAGSPGGIKFFENDGSGVFIDRGVIAESGATHHFAGVGVAVADIDGNGVPDIIVGSPGDVRIIKNPIQKK